jgi:hypothetical protein
MPTPCLQVGESYSEAKLFKTGQNLYTMLLSPALLKQGYTGKLLVGAPGMYVPTYIVPYVCSHLIRNERSRSYSLYVPSYVCNAQRVNVLTAARTSGLLAASRQPRAGLLLSLHSVSIPRPPSVSIRRLLCTHVMVAAIVAA